MSSKFQDNYDLWEHTDRHISRLRFKEPPSGYFYPSEASVKLTDEHGDTYTEGGCLRAAYFRISGEFERLPNEPRTEYIFMQGKIIEQALIDYWKEMGIWVANNVKFRDEENRISGELDVVLIEPETAQQYGVEVKTFYGYQAEKELFGNYKNPGFPKMSQLLQTLTYVNYWKDKGIPFFRMAYFARDSVKRTTFKVELQKEGNILYPKVDGEVIREFTMGDVLSRYKELKGYVDSKIVPPNDYELQYSDVKIEDFYKKGKIAKTKYEDYKKGKLGKHEYIGDWNCSYCAYKAVCWGSNRRNIEL
jgi:hypothetical protein